MAIKERDKPSRAWHATQRNSSYDKLEAHLGALVMEEINLQ